MTFAYPFTLAAATGDGCLGGWASKPGYTYCSFTHCGAQREYLQYKIARINQELGTRGNVSKVTVRTDPRTGSTNLTCQAMVTNPALGPLREMLYPNNTKTISSRILELIGLEGLAVLWMDDGCVVRGPYSRNRGLLSKYVSKGEAELLCKWIGDLTSAKALPNSDRGKWRIRIEMGQMPAFVTAVRRYIHSSMANKVTLVYQNWTRSRRMYEASLNIPFVDAGDKATRARSTALL